MITQKIQSVLCLLIALGLGVSTNAQTSIKKDREIIKLEKSLEQVLELSNCPGMSVAVVEKGEVVYAAGFGYKDYENKKPATANTLFAIGSCTKAFTAALIGQLEDEDELALEESPRKYLPELSFYNSRMDQMITVHDLLSHNTGLPRHDLSWYMFPTHSRDSLLMRIAHHEPTAEVREAYQYNNFMYMVAGMITERLSGRSWEDNIREKLFTPLQMTSSNLSIAELEKSDDFAFGYSTGNDEAPDRDDFYHIRGMAPAGSINSNAYDMGNWLIAWINNGEYNGNQVIPAHFASRAMSSQVVASGGFPGTKRPDLHIRNYGYGWDVSSYRGHYRVEHGGNIDGFTASTCFFPSDSLGIVVMVNQNYSIVPGLVRNIIADKKLGLKPGKWDEGLRKKKKESDEEDEEEVASEVSSRISGTRHSHDLEAYAGLFNHPGYGSIEVVVSNDSLMAVLPERKWWLRHNHYDVFEPFEIEETGIDTTHGSSIRFNFSTNNQGEIEDVALNIQSGLDPIVFARQLVAMEVDAAELEQYVGSYDMGGAIARIFIGDGGSLKLFVPGQQEYTLIASAKHKFEVEELDGYSLEFEKENGEITALMFIQPNGTFRVPRKD